MACEAPRSLPHRSLPYRSWVEVSRAQIAENFRAVRSVVGPEVEVMPVVKADAYRHGAVEVSRVLEQQGARWLAVSNTDEGVVLRDAGIRARILVMADFLPFTREAMLAYDLTPVVHSLEDIAELDRLASARERRVRYHLKIDTGMGRLGVRADTSGIADAILGAKNVELEGMMTHFASAGNYTSSQTDEQISLFDHVMEGLARTGVHPVLVHLSSTIPVAYGRRSAWRGLIRPGHAIYGYVSPARGHAPGKSVAGEAGAHVACDSSVGEGRFGGRADRIWRNVSRAAPDARGSFGGRVRGRHSAPAVESGQRHSERPTGADPGRGFDGLNVGGRERIAGDAGGGCGDATRDRGCGERRCSKD